MRLVETQEGQRRVINRYNQPITFTVEGGPDNCDYSWDLNGDGNYNTGQFEQGLANSARTISYGPTESTTSIQLIPNVSKHRKSYSISVQLTGGFVLTRNIHVALDGFYGTDLTGTSVASKNTGIQGIGTVGGTFDATPSTGIYSQTALENGLGIIQNINSNRLQYAPLIDDANGITVFQVISGHNIEVYGVFVGDAPYDNSVPQKAEDVRATIAHENQHVQQLNAIRDNSPSNNVWRLLNEYYVVDRGGGISSYLPFLEADAHFVEVEDENIGWYHLFGENQNDVPNFHNHYVNAVSLQQNMEENTQEDLDTKDATRGLLTNLYNDIPEEFSLQMKTFGWINNYDYYVRLPQ